MRSKPVQGTYLHFFKNFKRLLRALKGNDFWLHVISAAIYGDGDIKMVHSIILSTLSTQNIVGNISNSPIWRSKPWDSFGFVWKVFKKYCTFSYFLNLRDNLSKKLKCITDLWHEIFSHGGAWVSSLQLWS